MVQIIPDQANKAGCTTDYGNAGLIFSPGLTGHEWTADVKNPPAGKAQACPGRIEWIVHLMDAAGKIVQSTPRSYFDWNPL